ncbi:MAG: trigger factor [Chloroflexota bacterium]
MKVSTEKIEKSQVALSIELEPAEVEKSLEKAYRRLVQKVNIPGFRRGKAPRAVLERHIGKGALMEDALEHAIPETCGHAIQEQKVDAIGQPRIELVSMDPVSFKAIVPVRPTVKLCDYRAIRVESQPVEVTEEQVDAAIEQLRLQQAVLTPVERPVRFNDFLSMTVESRIGDRQLLNEKDAPYRVLKGLDMPLPGFAEKLEGAAIGEEREFGLIFPEDHPATEFRGKECQFKVKVTEVKEQTLPAVDDAFAKSLGVACETSEALREKVKADLKVRVEAVERARFEDRALQMLVECAQIEYPPVLLEAEVDRLIKQQVERVERGGLKMGDYLKSVNKTMEQLREEAQPVAERRLLRSLALGQLAEDEKVVVTPEEIAAEAERMSKDAGEKKEELRKFFELPSVRSSLENTILARKTVAHLVEIAQGKLEAGETSGVETPPPVTGEVEDTSK